MRRTTAVEQRRHQIDRRTTETLETRIIEMQEQVRHLQTQQTTGITNIWSLQTIGSLKPA